MAQNDSFSSDSWNNDPLAEGLTLPNLDSLMATSSTSSLSTVLLKTEDTLDSSSRRRGRESETDSQNERDEEVVESHRKRRTQEEPVERMSSDDEDDDDVDDEKRAYGLRGRSAEAGPLADASGTTDEFDNSNEVTDRLGRRIGKRGDQARCPYCHKKSTRSGIARHKCPFDENTTFGERAVATSVHLAEEAKGYGTKVRNANTEYSGTEESLERRKPAVGLRRGPTRTAPQGLTAAEIEESDWTLTSDMWDGAILRMEMQESRAGREIARRNKQQTSPPVPESWNQSLHFAFHEFMQPHLHAQRIREMSLLSRR